MKSRRLMWLIAAILLAALTIPVGLTAQEQEQKKDQRSSTITTSWLTLGRSAEHRVSSTQEVATTLIRSPRF